MARRKRKSAAYEGSEMHVRNYEGGAKMTVTLFASGLYVDFTFEEYPGVTLYEKLWGESLKAEVFYLVERKRWGQSHTDERIYNRDALMPVGKKVRLGRRRQPTNNEEAPCSVHNLS